MSRLRRTGAAFAPAILVVAAVGIGLGMPSLTPIVNPSIRPVGLEAHDSHAAVSLLGQFRTSASAWMFLRADLYLHNGVEMRPLSEVERQSGRRGVGTSDRPEDQLHDDSNVVTVVPEKARDFRGLLGDLERAGSAYKDMTGHGHNDPVASLPLFRLMTILDPQFIPGWTVGAAILARDHGRPATEKSMALLREGLEHNPQSPEILGSIGKLYLTRGTRTDAQGRLVRDLIRARPWYRKAVDAAESNKTRLSEPEREAALENARFAAMLEREAGDCAAMRRVLDHGLGLFPDDGILQRLAREALERNLP